MARSSNTTLTKFVSATTILTANIANSLYGGLFGSTEGDAYNADDPLNAGHLHDGDHKDGHAQKINLENHVTGELRNTNVADDAIIKRNIQSFLDQSTAIPEFEVIDGNTYYFLDLTDVRSEIAANGAFLTATNITSNSPGNLTVDDFVFGSNSLDDDGNAGHDNRIIFDKSKAAFRVGAAEASQWDDLNRGTYSTAFGRNNTAAAARSVAAGGDANIISATATDSFIGSGSTNSTAAIGSLIGTGNTNTIGVSSNYAAILAGATNSISTGSVGAVILTGFGNSIGTGATRSVIGSGLNNAINSYVTYGFIGGGTTNTLGDGVTAITRSAILAGVDNTVESDSSAVVAGDTNIIRGDRSFIGSGLDNTIDTLVTDAVIGGGRGNTIGDGISAFLYSGILSGQLNSIYSTYSGIVSGLGNQVKGVESFIGGGGGNAITFLGAGAPVDLTGCAIVTGAANTITSTDGESATYNFIGGGSSNTITAGVIATQTAERSSILGGSGNEINDADYAFILGGSNNIIKSTATNKLDYASIWGGDGNEVEAHAVGGKVHGFYGRAYMYNQHAHGAGDFDAGELTKGQAQTSVLVGFREITAAATPTTISLNGAGTTEGLFDIPTGHGLIAKATWVCMHDDGAGTELAVGGERVAVIKNIAGTRTIVTQSDQLAPTADGGLVVSAAWATSGATNFAFRLTSNLVNVTRAVVRVEITQVFNA